MSVCLIKVIEDRIQTKFGREGPNTSVIFLEASVVKMFS